MEEAGGRGGKGGGFLAMSQKCFQPTIVGLSVPPPPVSLSRLAASHPTATSFHRLAACLGQNLEDPNTAR